MNAVGQVFFEIAFAVTLGGLAVAGWSYATRARPRLAPTTLAEAMHPRRLKEAAHSMPRVGWPLVAALVGLVTADAIATAVAQHAWYASLDHAPGPDGVRDVAHALALQLRDVLLTNPFSGALRALRWELWTVGYLAVLGGVLGLLLVSARARAELSRVVGLLGWGTWRMSAVGCATVLVPSLLAGVAAMTISYSWMLRGGDDALGPRWIGSLHLLAVPASWILSALFTVLVHGALRCRLASSAPVWPGVLDQLGERTWRVMLALLFLSLGSWPLMLSGFTSSWPMGWGNWLLVELLPAIFAWITPLVLFAALESPEPAAAAKGLLRERPMELLGVLLLGALVPVATGLGLSALALVLSVEDPGARLAAGALERPILELASLLALCLWIPWFSTAFRDQGDASVAPTGAGTAGPGEA